jgi:hypothetical protein
MLMNLPHNCYEKLMPPIQRNPQDPAEEFEYDGRNMEAVAKLLDFLYYKLNLTEQVSNIFCNSNSKHSELYPFQTTTPKMFSCPRH